MPEYIIFIDPIYSQYSPETENSPVTLRVKNDAQLVMSLLMGFSNDANKWTPLATDSSGRVQTTDDAGSVSSTLSSTQTVTTSNSTPLSANSNRRQFILRNKGSVDIHFSLSDIAATTSDFLLKAGEIWIETEWLGEVNMITASGSTDIDILEYLE